MHARTKWQTSFTPLNTTNIGHFTVVCLVTWPINGSEAGGELALIDLLFSCNCNQLALKQIDFTTKAGRSVSKKGLPGPAANQRLGH